VIVENGEKILEVKQELDETLQEQLVAPEKRLDRESVLAGLEETFVLSADRETAEELAQAIYAYLIVSGQNRVDTLRDLGASEGLVKYLNSLSVKYNIDATDVYYSTRQGPKYWRSVRSEIVFREPDGTPGLNHRIRIGKENEIELTVSLDSNLSFIQRLLVEQQDAMGTLEHFGAQEITSEQLDQIEELVNEIRRNFEEGQEQTEDTE
jgi:hypothetical protein